MTSLRVNTLIVQNRFVSIPSNGKLKFIGLRKKTFELSVARGVTRKDRVDVRRSQVSLGNLTKHIAEVCRQCQIASFIKLRILQPRPFAVNFAPAHTVTNDKHRVRMTVISSAVPVLFYGASKFRHRQNNHVVHALAQVGVKGSDAAAELLQQVSQLAARITFIDVRVPAANISERDLKAHAGFY